MTINTKEEQEPHLRPSYDDLYKFWAQQGSPEIVDIGNFKVRVGTTWNEGDILSWLNDVLPIHEDEGGPWQMDDSVAVDRLPDLFKGLGVYDFKTWEIMQQINQFRTRLNSDARDPNTVERLLSRIDEFFTNVATTAARTDPK